MPTHPLAPTRSISSRLAALMSDILLARAEVRALRCQPVVPDRLASARQVLLVAMEAYAVELTERRLPIPRQLRDELRLQRAARRPRGEFR